MRGGSAQVVVNRSNIVMMKIVGFEHVEVVILLKTDGDGPIIVLDQSMSPKFEVLMNSKLGHMFEFKDVVDLGDEVLT